MRYVADRAPWLVLLGLLSLILAIYAGGQWEREPTGFTAEGTILVAEPGAWDARFDHGSAGALIEKDGMYFLYYIGASGDRTTDGGPAHRKLGVATASRLSGAWVKHPANPLLEHSPNGREEEGFWRVAAMVADDSTTVLLFATVLTGSGGSVRGDIKLFTSTNGLSFADRGVVLSHDDEQVFGSGDELGVLGVYRDSGGTFHLYYTAKSKDERWSVGHASGPAPTRLISTKEAYDPSFEVGHGSNPIRIGESVYVPLQDNAGTIEIHETSEAALGELGNIVATYSSLGSDLGSLHLAGDRWYVTISDASDGSGAIRLYSAPGLPAGPDM